MSDRPSRRCWISPARVRCARWNDSEELGIPSCWAIAPAGIPSAPACTSRRKRVRRCSCASAPSASTAAGEFISIRVEVWPLGCSVNRYFDYGRNNSRLPALWPLLREQGGVAEPLWMAASGALCLGSGLAANGPVVDMTLLVQRNFGLNGREMQAALVVQRTKISAEDVPTRPRPHEPQPPISRRAHNRADLFSARPK